MAVATLDRSFSRSDYWGPAGTPQAIGWADAIRRCFNTYVDLASSDGRRAFMTGYTADLDYGANELGVYVDVVLLDPRGYAARTVLWGSDQPDATQATLMASPIVEALGNDLGGDRVAEVEVWHLRSGTVLRVDANQALRVRTNAIVIVNRAAQ